MYLWYNRKPPQARGPAIRATGVVRAIPIERSTRKATRIKSRFGTSLVLKYPMGDDAAPPKRARAARLRPASIHRIAIDRRMKHLGAHLPDLRVERAELHVERRLAQLQQPDDFDDVRHAGGRLRVTDVALDGANGA